MSEIEVFPELEPNHINDHITVFMVRGVDTTTAAYRFFASHLPDLLIRGYEEVLSTARLQPYSELVFTVNELSDYEYTVSLVYAEKTYSILIIQGNEAIAHYMISQDYKPQPILITVEDN